MRRLGTIEPQRQQLEGVVLQVLVLMEETRLCPSGDTPPPKSTEVPGSWENAHSPRTPIRPWEGSIFL